MRRLAVLLMASLLAVWVVVVAVVSVQNAFIVTEQGPTLATLTFFGQQTPPLPFGVVLAAGMALGALLMGMAIALPRQRS
ncbi:MAG: DUF1049 domain-containing protein [Cyanobacteria bacterium P01_A01_bin.135]